MLSQHSVDLEKIEKGFKGGTAKEEEKWNCWTMECFSEWVAFKKIDHFKWAAKHFFP